MTLLRRSGTPEVDFDVHGLARVRLTYPSQRDIAAVAWQLGSPASPSSGEADLVVEYSDSLPSSAGARFIGTGGAGFTSSAFYPWGLGKASATILPFDDLGTSRMRLLLQRGIGRVQHLTGLLNLTMLGKGVVPLHAAAFLLGAQGIAACGWSKSGKSEALLGFMSLGATAIGDEWIYLAPDGHMYGLGSPVRIESRHLHDLPTCQNALTWRARRRMQVGAVAGSLSAAFEWGGSVMKPMSRGLAKLSPWSHSDVPAERLFGRDRVAGHGPLDRLFLLMSADVDDIVVRPMDALEAANRLVFAHQHHRRALLASYLEFRYAFPNRKSELIETAEMHERELLTRYLGGKPAFLVEHPHPVAVKPLAGAMLEFCRVSKASQSSDP